ncbi:thiamine-phosphate pyrophosphorylase [Candidatus Magnetomorum sp. HK-1]|nr:thiamine-phosphate pyrophosphorylase [Candidatus Magnetomorum sp. HK-1]
MNNHFRIIDANLNRVSEGIRVIEDIFRFEYESSSFTQELRSLRHHVRNSTGIIMPELLNSRQTELDPGVAISAHAHDDKRKNKMDLIHANFKRVQEGLRSIEEVLKTADKYDIAKQYESIRFQAYALEKKCFNFCSSTQKMRKNIFPDTDIYCLTAEELSCGRSNITVVEEMIRAGIKIIQYREKEKSFREKYNECTKIREMTQAKGVKFIVNDNIDLALMTNADGVHIGQTDYPVEAVRKLTGDDFIIGLSTHAPEEAMKAQDAGVDYIGVGPIYSTNTKKDVCAPVGHAYLEYVLANISIPFVAIGGIKEHNLVDIIRRGTRCVGIVSEITGAKNIGQKIKTIRKKIKEYQNDI